jgi:hypothetical protein
MVRAASMRGPDSTIIDGQKNSSPKKSAAGNMHI